MSQLLALLATGEGTPIVNPPVDPPATPWVTALSPTWHNTVRVGPTRTHTTVDSAVTAIFADDGGVASTGPSTGDYGGGMFRGIPRVARYRSVIVCDPGTYTISGNYLNLHGGVDIVGATGNPADVVIVGGLGGANPGYVANVVDDFYCGHVTLRIPDQAATTGKSYAVHMTGRGLDLPTTNIFENVVIQDQQVSARHGGPLGWDGPDNSMLYIKGCTFTSPRSMILHGDSTPTGIQVVVKDSTMNIPALGGFPGGTLITSNVTQNGSPVADSGTVPTLTNGSHRPARYAPSTSTTGPVTLRPLASAPSDLGPVALTPGRVYFVPIPVTTAGRVNQVIASLTTVAGTVALGLYSETSAALLPASLGGIYGAPVAATAAPAKGHNPATDWPRSYVTRDHTLWAAILVTDAAARAEGSTTLSSAVTCYRSTSTSETTLGGFPVAAEVVPAGTPVPWLGLTLT